MIRLKSTAKRQKTEKQKCEEKITVCEVKSEQESDKSG